ncbi:SMP-30/gluconolactonase/LRE family protein [Sagittula sp. SSi028]|uniref:SMP-30/gluconolactonase/LRE family protein n=1 Tax=Sagittula sp. SSi028 TaxID=3400636 RepID=UPI003AF98E8F
MRDVTILSDTKCILGEGALWHPERQSFLWFDILGHTLFEHDGTQQKQWLFDRAVSAAGWVSAREIIIASERDLFVFDLESAQERHLLPLEADNLVTRSNDGRADPFGGFWIGTMGYRLEPGAGAIYRYWRGTLRKIFDGLTIPNAICFAPDGKTAYFADTPEGRVQRVALDAEGWPVGTPEVHIDTRAEGVNPDGAVIDAEGRLWTAQWGASRVACYGVDGAFVRAVSLPAVQVSCPAFGGPDLRRLFVTSAAEGAEDDPAAGQTFFTDLEDAQGRPEPQVIL